MAKVTGNIRVTKSGTSSDVHHIILDFGAQAFPVLEGQSVGIVPPGVDAKGRPPAMRLYSICSARDGERPNTNNLALTVKRVAEPQPDGEGHLLARLQRGAIDDQPRRDLRNDFDFGQPIVLQRPPRRNQIDDTA